MSLNMYTAAAPYFEIKSGNGLYFFYIHRLKIKLYEKNSTRSFYASWS